MIDYSEYFKLFIGLVAIVNPIGVIPVFISMTSDESREELYKTINLVPIGVATILLVTLFLGEALLTLFGITVDSFRVGGGILILLMAIAMLHARTGNLKQTEEEASESVDKQSVAIVPLAMPLLAGPGAISTIILAAHKSSGFVHYAVLSFAILILSSLVWVVLRLSPLINQHISATGLNVFTRIMGLLLAAIAVEFIANGIKGLFPALA